MRKKYILWDQDGVLVDTEKWYYKANLRALNEIGIEITEETYMFYMQNGISVWKIPKEKGISDELIEKQRKKRNEYYQNFLEKEDIEIDNVTNVLNTLRASFRMAIITTSRKEDFELIHKTRNILQYMDFYLTLGDYNRAKPYPDPYLSGMHIFDATPDECIIIEDSGRGLKSAVSAGIDCVIVRNEFTNTHDFTGAMHILNSVDELPNILHVLKR